MLSRNDRRSGRAEWMRQQIAERGLTLMRHGQAWRIVGVGVDVLTADYALLDVRDLNPVSHE